MKNHLPPAIKQAILTALKGVGALLDGATVKLYKNPLIVADNVVIGDLEEADFDGYAESTAIVWGAPFLDVLKRAHLVGDTKLFVCTGETTPNTIYGFYVVDGATLLYVKEFDAPIGVTSTGFGLPVVPTFELRADDLPDIPGV